VRPTIGQFAPWLALGFLVQRGRAQRARAARAARAPAAARPAAPGAFRPATPASSPAAVIVPRTGLPPPPGGGLRGSGAGLVKVPSWATPVLLAQLKSMGLSPTAIAHLTAAQAKMLAAASPAALRAQLQKFIAARPAALAKAKRARPDPMGEPADQNAFMQPGHPGQGFHPDELWPEWHWEKTGHGGEARGFVQRSGDDWVHWYVAPDYSWSYDHHWGGGFDLKRSLHQASQLVSDAASAAGQALHVVTAPFFAAVDAADHLLGQQLDKLAASLPPGVARDLVHGVKSGADFLATTTEATVTLDPSRVPWQSLADTLEAATSVVPVLGTAVSDIIATGEVLIDALRSGNALEAGLRAAYAYAMASVPGAAALRPEIDPVVDVLIRIAADGEKPTAAVIGAAVDQAPDSPSIGNLSPRSVAASLASIVVSHLGLA
jgi:hypothetical protein